MNRQRENDAEPEIADARGLFEDSEPESSPRPSPARGEAEENYGLVDGPGVEDVEAEAPIPRQLPQAAPRPKAPRPDTGRAVDVEVWTRGREWAPTLVRLGLAGSAVLVGLVIAVQAGSLQGFLLIALLGVPILAAVGYPILITLERPVRLTPEQAIKDYYAALSHGRPHFLRMWTLLSRKGQRASAFRDFDSFRGYWQEQLAKLQGNRSRWWNPLEFAVASYRGEKPKDLTDIRSNYEVQVTLRGQSVGRFAGSARLVKGPDRMWYLEDGALPKPSREEAG